MQLHVAIEQLPEDSPPRSRLNQVQQLMGRFIFPRREYSTQA
jgi:hypothetical protein